VIDDGRVWLAGLAVLGGLVVAKRSLGGSSAKPGEDIAAEGPRAVVVWGRRCNGSQPGKRFLEDQDPADQAVIERLFSYYVRGLPMDKTQFRIEKDAGCDETIAVFKSFQVRLFAVLSGRVGGRGRVVITHGYTKKQDKARPNEFTRACKLFAEHERVMRGDCGQVETGETELREQAEPEWRRDLDRRHEAFVEQQRRRALERAAARAEEQAELQRLLEQQRRQVALRAAARAEDQAELQRMLEEQRQRLAPPAPSVPRAVRKPARRWTSYVETPEEILALIRRALAEEMELELDYRTRSGGAVSSRVQPERMASKGDQLVLVGLDADEDRPLSFFLDQIERVRARSRK